jgi:hypothetical protein
MTTQDNPDREHAAPEPCDMAEWPHWCERVALFKATHPDWDAVVNQPIRMHLCVQAELLKRDDGPAITYFLGKNPDYLEFLVQISPQLALAAIEQLSKALASPQQAAKTASVGSIFASLFRAGDAKPSDQTITDPNGKPDNLQVN